MKDKDQIGQLLAESAWLQRLALDLVHEAAAAEDLVQDTYLAAVKRPPSELRSARAWLGTVLRRTWAKRKLRESNEARRKLSVDSENSSPATDELQAKAEWQRRLHIALGQLGEETRKTIVFRYFGDLSAADIAARQNCSVETVKSRLKRGRAALRKKLSDAEGSGDLKFASLLALSSPPQSASGMSSSFLLGAYVVNKKIMLAGVFLLALVVVIPISGVFSSRDDDSVDISQEDALVGGEGATRRPRPSKNGEPILNEKASSEINSDSRAGDEASEDAAVAELSGVLISSAGQPLSNVRVVRQPTETLNYQLMFDGVELGREQWRRRDIQETRTDAGGRFRFEGVSGRSDIAAFPVGYQIASAWNVAARAADLQLVTRRAEPVSLKVIDDDRRAVDGAEVLIILHAQRIRKEMYLRAVTDAAGKLSLCAPDVDDMLFLQLRKVGFLTKSVNPITAMKSGKEVEVDFSRGRRLEVAFQLDDGTKAPAGLQVGLSTPALLTPILAEGDGDGVVVVDPAPAGAHLYLRMMSQGFAILDEAGAKPLQGRKLSDRIRLGRKLDVKPGGDARIVLTLVRTGAISGRILTRDAKAVAGLELLVRPAISDIRGMKINTRRGTTDAEGRFRIENVPPGERYLSASSDAWHLDVQKGVRLGGGAAKPDIAAFTMPPGTDLEGLTLEAVPAARLAGRVRDESGAGIAGVTVTVFRSFEKGKSAYSTPALLLSELDSPETRTDREGRFELAGVPSDRPVRLVAHNDRHASAWSDEIRIRSGSETEEIDLVMKAPVLIEGVCRDESGQPVADFPLAVEGPAEVDSRLTGLLAMRITSSRHLSRRVLRTDEQGQFRVLMPRGDVSFDRGDARSEKIVSKASRQQKVQDDGVRVEVLLESAPRFELRVVTEDGQPLAGASVLFRETKDEKVIPRRFWTHRVTDDDGVIVLSMEARTDLEPYQVYRQKKVGAPLESFELLDTLHLKADSERQEIRVKARSGRKG